MLAVSFSVVHSDDLLTGVFQNKYILSYLIHIMMKFKKSGTLVAV